MTREEYFGLYEAVYRLTDDVTPCRFDCGELCEKACCRDLSRGDKPSGMALLPGEKEYLLQKGCDGFEFFNGEDGEIVVCHGKCNRENRPFACRIFPYYADVSSGKIVLKKDLRAASVCPLLVDKTHKRKNIYFIRGIKRAVSLLLTCTDTADDIMRTADFIGSLYDFYAKTQI